MTPLSPSKLVSIAASPDHGGQWFRFTRTSDGILCLESITDASLNSDPVAEWSFCAEVPRYIAKQISDDDDPDQVARVLDRALRALQYT